MGLTSKAHWVRIEGKSLYRYYKDMDIWHVSSSRLKEDQVIAYLIEKVPGVETDGKCMWNGNDGDRYPTIMMIYEIDEKREYTDKEVEKLAVEEWNDYSNYYLNREEPMPMDYYRVR